MKPALRRTVFTLLIVAAVAILAMTLMPHQQIYIDGERLDSFPAFGAILACIGVGAIATVLGLFITGFVLAGVSALMLLIFGAMLIALAATMLPLALPFLLIAAIVMLVQHLSKPRKTAS